jgi:hypothetical protein
MPKARNTPDEFRTRNSKAARATGEDDVEGHALKGRVAPDELKGARMTTKAPRATGEDDVEGHALKTRIAPGEGLLARNAPDEFRTRNSKAARATGDDDVEGHWMPDAGSSLRLAKARNSDIERDARQHQLANDARQARLDHDP